MNSKGLLCKFRPPSGVRHCEERLLRRSNPEQCLGCFVAKGAPRNDELRCNDDTDKLRYVRINK